MVGSVRYVSPHSNDPCFFPKLYEGLSPRLFGNDFR